MKHLLCATLAVALFAGIFPATAAANDSDRDWVKVEEPALRPVKAVGRGFAAFWYQTVQALARGNEKLPIFGSVEVFRGMRHGLVEFAEHTATGMTHSSNARDWRTTGAANAVIDEDILLRNAADFLTATAVARVPGASIQDSATFGAAVWAAQKGVDRSPVSTLEDDRLERRVQRARESYLMQVGHERTRVQAMPAVEEPEWKRAQRSYIGDRADTNPRQDNAGGNLLRLGR